MIKFAAFCFISLGLISCMWGVPNNTPPAITTDTLFYTYKIIKQRASDCGSKPDSGCTVVRIKYPVFKTQKRLNDSIIWKLTNLLQLDDVVKASGLETYSQSFLKGYLKTIKHFPEYANAYSLNMYSNVIRQDSSLTTLEVGGYAFQTGARGTTSICFINWDTKANRNLLLSDLFTNNSLDKLNKVGEMIFRKNEKLSDTTSLSYNYVFKGNKFSLNNNFLITPLGIRFFYNEYEIKPRGAGSTSLFIPYTQIKSLLRPNTVITQYIK
jgi:Protein of unknown function (DUF3298)